MKASRAFKILWTLRVLCVHKMHNNQKSWNTKEKYLVKYVGWTSYMWIDHLSLHPLFSEVVRKVSSLPFALLHRKLTVFGNQFVFKCRRAVFVISVHTLKTTVWCWFFLRRTALLQNTAELF